MAIASASQTRLAIVPEVTWGTTPSNPVFQNVRYTGESLKINRQSVTSSEIRADRNVADSSQVSGGAGGDINIEWAYDDAIELLLPSLMFGSWSTDVLKNGTTQSSFSIEKKFENGATDVYYRMTGMVANTLSLNVRAGQIATGSFGLLGKGGSVATTAISGATYTAAGTSEIFNATSDFASLSVGSLTTPKVMGLTLSASNNLRAQNVVGSFDAAGIGAGRMQLTGTMEVYLENKELLDLFLADTASSLSFIIGGVTTEKYQFDVGTLKFTDATVTAGGNDQDVMASAQWTGLYDTSDDCTLKITRGVA